MTYLKVQTNCPSRYLMAQPHQNICQHYCHNFKLPALGKYDTILNCSWLQLPQCTFEPWKHVILHKVYYDPHVACLFTVLLTIFSVVFIFQCKKWQENLKQSIILVMKTVYQMLHSLIATYETYILLVCSIAVYFNESCNILASPKGKSKYKWQVKIYSDTIY